MKFFTITSLLFAVTLSKPVQIQFPEVLDTEIYSESELETYEFAPVSNADNDFGPDLKLKLCQYSFKSKTTDCAIPMIPDDILLDGDMPAQESDPANLPGVAFEQIDLDLFDAQDYADVLDSEAEFDRNGRDYYLIN